MGVCPSRKVAEDAVKLKGAPAGAPLVSLKPIDAPGPGAVGPALRRAHAKLQVEMKDSRGPSALGGPLPPELRTFAPAARTAEARTAREEAPPPQPAPVLSSDCWESFLEDKRGPWERRKNGGAAVGLAPKSDGTFTSCAPSSTTSRQSRLRKRSRCVGSESTVRSS